MNLIILLFFGILGSVCAVYKIPEHDACVLRVLLCDDFTKPLTPIDNSTLEMFESIGQLNAICDELSKFRVCLKKAEKFCKENSELNVGFDLLNNRRLVFDLCVRGSAHQHVYMMVEGCVNKYSHSAIEFCTDRAVETVGLAFDLGDYDSECRFLGTIQHCHIAVITDQCGSIAGNMLEKLVVFRGERDFLCIGYEKERLKNLEAFYATMDSYVQQYRNTVDKIETEDKSEKTDEVKIFETPQESSSQFHSRISPLADEDFDSNKKYMSSHEILDSTYTSRNTAQPATTNSGKVLSDEKYACKTKTSFLLMGIRPNGEHYQLGYGEADVLWDTFSPLKDTTCFWMVDRAAPMSLFKCLILIDSSVVTREDCKIKRERDLSFNATIGVYETVNEREAKRVAELRVHSFSKHSPFERRKDNVVNFFKNHAHDIRFWCSDRHEANLFNEPNTVHSTSRIGFIPSDVYNYGTVNRQSKVSNQKYDFYMPEQSEHAIDTEIHLISSGDESLEDKLIVGENYASQSHDENLNPFLSDEMFIGEDSDESYTLRPFTPLESSSHSYRPYELYRPRMGEVLVAQDQDILDEDVGIQLAVKSNPYPDVLPFDYDAENGYSRYLYPEEMCPKIPENISKLVNKPRRDSKINYMDIADPLNIVESKRYKIISKSEKRKSNPVRNGISKAEEPLNIATNTKQNRYDEIFIVTQSAKIETSSAPVRMVYENSDMQNLDKTSRVLNTNENNQDSVEIPQESDFNGLAHEKNCLLKSTNDESPIVNFSEFSPNYQNDKHPFSNKFIDATTNHKVDPEEQLLPKSEILSRRSTRIYYNPEDEEFVTSWERELYVMKKRLNEILAEMVTRINKTKPGKIEL